MQKKKVIINEIDKIIEYLETRSNSMVTLIKNDPNSEYTLFQKYITHSDLISSGKRKGNESVESNYLYYLSNSEMHEMDKKKANGKCKTIKYWFA